MVDHDCIAYSNTVEIFFTQQDVLQTVMFKHCDYITIALAIVDIQTKVQDPALCNKSGPQVVL